MSMSIRNVIEQIDWPLLREQKEYVFNESANSAVGHLYEGILGLLDAIQDAAVNDGIATEAEVFGEFPE